MGGEAGAGHHTMMIVMGSDAVVALVRAGETATVTVSANVRWIARETGIGIAIATEKEKGTVNLTSEIASNAVRIWTVAWNVRIVTDRRPNHRRRIDPRVEQRLGL